jgi:ABC-2 type transport system permease protein
MAGINTASEALSSMELSRQQFKTIAWLRWRIFVNAMRGKGATGELVVRIISYPFLALLIFGPAVGAGAASWYFVTSHMDAFLAIPLWVIFGLWQFIGVSTSTSGPSFDLSTLIRFPIRYRDYLLVRLSFGLLDPPTLAGLACLTAMCIGIGVAAPALVLWALPALLFYAIANILFSRMVYSWMERWMAQRRTRELVTVLILVVSLGIQVISQFAGRIGNAHHAPLSPAMLKAAHVLLTINWLLPPGLTTFAIEHAHGGFPLLAIAALGGTTLYALIFLLILHVRLRAQYLGENLSEAPASRVRKAKTASVRTAALSARRNAVSGVRRGFLPDTVSACLIKEVRYLLRSGPKLYGLIMPVFMVFLFSARNAGMHQAGMQFGAFNGFLFTYGCAYTQLIFVSLLYNSLGGDGAGVQFYFLAPLRMREVMLAKNLLTGVILVIEILLLYLTASIISKPPRPALAAATVVWTLFAFFLNMGIGNIRSLSSPKGVDPAKIRRQNVSGVSSLISLGVVFGTVALGGATIFLCNWIGLSYWVAAAVFLVLAGISFGVYLLIFNRLDSIAAEHMEDLTRELSKA